MHAGWNFVSKRRHPTAGFFLTANMAGAALLSPLVVRYDYLVAAFPWQTWCLLAASGLFLAVYFSGHGVSYGDADKALFSISDRLFGIDQ